MSSQIPAQAHEKLVARLSALGIPRPAITTLLERHTLVRFPKGTSLFSKGSPADVAFAILSGTVKVLSSKPGTDRVLIEIAGPGDVVGYADFVGAGGEHSQLFEAVSLSNCCAALFTRQHLVEVLKTLEPETILRITEAINTMWASMVYRYASFLGMSLRKRLETVLSELAAKFGVPDSRGVLLTAELAQEELAEMIGSSRPMVSKLLMEMAEQGHLAREGRHILLLRRKPETLALPESVRSSIMINRLIPAGRSVRGTSPAAA